MPVPSSTTAKFYVNDKCIQQKKKKTTDVNICIHINICKLHHERHYFQGKVQAEVSANFLKIQVGSPSIIFNMLKRPDIPILFSGFSPNRNNVLKQNTIIALQSVFKESQPLVRM